MACDQEARRANSGVQAREGAMASGSTRDVPGWLMTDAPSATGRTG